MTTSRTATSVAALATALMTGCAVQPRTYPAVYEQRTEPAVLSFPQTQSFETRLAWKGPETLGNCVGYERASAGPIPAGSSASVAQTLNMDTGTSTAFAGLTRTGLTISCGIGNPMAEVRAPQPARSARQVVPAVTAPVFNNIRIAHTGDYLMPNNFTQCKATLVLVQPSTLQPGHSMPDMIHGPRALPEFGGYQVPAGWAVPKVPVAYNGRAEGSSLLCTHAMTLTTPRVLGHQ